MVFRWARLSSALPLTAAQWGAEVVIPSTRSRKLPILYHKSAHKLRNRVERCIEKLRHFRRLATRYDLCADYFLAFSYLAAIVFAWAECGFVLVHPFECRAGGFAIGRTGHWSLH